jgi:hypothetical protein
MLTDHGSGRDTGRAPRRVNHPRGRGHTDLQRFLDQCVLVGIQRSHRWIRVQSTRSADHHGVTDLEGVFDPGNHSRSWPPGRQKLLAQ